jgi:hypothetical protein
MATLTENALGVFWEGEEAPGVIAYGLWTPAIEREPAFPGDVWPTGTKHRASTMAGPWADEPWESSTPWEILRWDVLVPTWPQAANWAATLRATLKALIDAGANVAWFAIEGAFAEPPELFDQAKMPEGVWAAMTSDGRFMCHAEIGEPFRLLSNDELAELRTFVPQ